MKSSLFTLFMLVILLTGSFQMSPMPPLPAAAQTVEMPMDADPGHAMAEMPGCEGSNGCDQQSTCAGHLCSGIPLMVVLDLPQVGLASPPYTESSDSLSPVPQDRPPRFPVI
ncbi:hypothetical protein [Neptuniibacter halophilus]|uniref:hypothetical protein n=1 Tax=Neptuniibacter halophilus TaxID=651666 RepID=UPI0025731149|nr:hypothetical protein [Neptuniibacter halophilus]